jgi:hypothetical protein
VYLDGKKLDTVVTNPDDVRDKDAAVKFGTAYQTQTNLNTGRDVVSTLAVIPEPVAAKRLARRGGAKAAVTVTPTPRRR